MCGLQQNNQILPSLHSSKKFKAGTMTEEEFSSKSEMEAVPYSLLARIYDHMMAHVNYYQWAQYIMQIIRRQGIADIHLLDIGCGTGLFLHQMKRLGISGAGCDPSEEMLKIARQRNPDLQFWHCGLPGLSAIPFKHFNVITCLYDTINYILQPQQLIESFSEVFKHLTAPGLFIFDIATEKNSREHFSNSFEREIISEKFAYVRESYYDSATEIQHNWVKIYTQDGIFVEHHRQRIYSPEQIRSLIKKFTDFCVLHMYDEFTFSPMHQDSTRVHFILKKVVGI